MTTTTIEGDAPEIQTRAPRRTKQEILPVVASGVGVIEQCAQITATVARLATDPKVNVIKLDKLIGMQERLMERAQKVAFMRDLRDLQPKLPVIDRKGRIEIRKKTATGERDGEVQQSSPYARWEDIHDAIRPVLHEFGFNLTFRSRPTTDGKIVVAAILGHVDGWTEENETPPLMHDSTGSKNNVQAVGSSLSYGKRYAATMLLNINTRGEDDDGQATKRIEPITDAQKKELEVLAKKADANMDKFLELFGIEKLEELPTGRFGEAKAQLNRKIKSQQALKPAGDQKGGML